MHCVMTVAVELPLKRKNASARPSKRARESIRNKFSLSGPNYDFPTKLVARESL